MMLVTWFTRIDKCTEHNEYRNKNF